MRASPRKRQPNQIRALPRGPKILSTEDTARKTKKKKIFTSIARLQLERRYRQLQQVEQFPFQGDIAHTKRIEKNWAKRKPKEYDKLSDKTGISAEALRNLDNWQREKDTRVLRERPFETNIRGQQSATKKMVRFKRGKRNKNRIVQTILTSEGKFRRLLFGGASQEWSEMDGQRRERYQHIVTEIIAKYAQSVSRRKGNTRKTIKQVRLNIIPELQRSKEFLEQTIQEKKQNLDQMGEKRLHNMVSVIDGLITKMSEPIPRERALMVRPTETNTRPTITFPGAAALEQMKRGGIPAEVLKRMIQQRLNQQNAKPLTSEDVRAAARARDAELRVKGILQQLKNAQLSGDPEQIRIARARIEGEISRRMEGPTAGNRVRILPARQIGDEPTRKDAANQPSRELNWRERTRKRWNTIEQRTLELGKRLFRRKKDNEK